MNEGNELIHEIRDFLKVRWNMASDVDGLFAEATAKLGNPCNRDMVQSPEGVFVESRWSLLQTDFHKSCEKIILPSKVLFLKSSEQVRIFFLPDKHRYERTGPLDFVSLGSRGAVSTRCAQTLS